VPNIFGHPVCPPVGLQNVIQKVIVLITD